jgi:hypothetical protein
MGETDQWGKSPVAIKRRTIIYLSFSAPLILPVFMRIPEKGSAGRSSVVPVRGWLTRRGTGPRREMFNPAERWLSIEKC